MSNTTVKTVSIRNELVELINKECTVDEVSFSEVVRKALKYYFFERSYNNQYNEGVFKPKRTTRTGRS